MVESSLTTDTRLSIGLDETEFAIVLQAAMQYVSTIKTRSDKTAVLKRQGAVVSGPRSAREVFSQCSHRVGRNPQDATATRDVFE